jgi:cell division protein FtsI/penicillin-binding protein 2
MKIRFICIISIFLALYGTLGFNLYRIQIQKSDQYVRQAEAREGINAKPLRRGQIFFTDKHSNEIPIAINKKYPSIYAVPKKIENPAKTAERLAPVIGWDETELAEALDNPDSLYRLLVERAENEKVTAVEESNIPGIYIGESKLRHYPFENLAAHVIGFVGINSEYKIPRGLYGVERYYQSDLHEEENVSITIDRNLQAESERILRELINKFDAAGGTIIVQDPSTGKLRVLANAPDFNPNTYGEASVEKFINTATQNVYEAGSVFKPITMAAGIDQGVITPYTTYEDYGSIEVSGETISNWDGKAHGTITMTSVIENSVNTGSVFVAQKVGRENFKEYLEKFGFGEVTEVDLPEEVPGSIRNIGENTYAIDLAAASFGQGTAVTPIQMVNAFSGLANGGVLMRPSINATTKPNVIRRAVKEETAKAVTTMMESAVEKAGAASLPQHRIAGKTGTAQIADLQKGGYGDEFTHTFIGFGPISNPKFTILIKLDKPDEQFAGRTVVPVFKELAEFIVSYYNIPPDK